MSLPTLFQQYIHLSRYSRWQEDKKRRETWEETVSRYFDFFDEYLNQKFPNFEYNKIRKDLESKVLSLEVMPSMRAIMTAGPALKRDHIAGYNCSYIPIDRTTSFDEILFILMNGTGVGFSVERQYINQLPVIADSFYPSDIKIIVADSKVGWAKALKELIHLLYGGQIPSWDISKLRPAGAPLKTFGGRSSGPEPLVDLFKFTVNLFKNAAGRKLTSAECHDLVCKIAEIVVVGGVRRSALISLSNLSDDRMRLAKTGNWWEQFPHRRLANNSAAYTEKPEVGIFMEEWLSLYNSKSGERGIFNRHSIKKKIDGRRNYEDFEFGTNPCGEILLRPNEFCNLSEIVIRPEDTLKTLKEKVVYATILGTLQSTLTDFRYLNSRWKKNCEEERLLGVSLTGIMDNDLTNGRKGLEVLGKALEEMKQVAIETNKKYAEMLGIPASVAITCVKPSGTVSSLVGTSSGIHPAHSSYYIRTVRADKKDPLARMMVDSGFPVEDDVMSPQHTYVFSFPIEKNKQSIFRNELTAIEHLEIWKTYKEFWCEHNPSVTINVKENEWMEVGAWVYNNFDDVCGVSFLPYSDHIYRQAPFQECSDAEYSELVKKMPQNVDWNKLAEYENIDNTVGSQELACVAGGCEII